MEQARPGIRFALYAAAASGALTSALFLVSAAWDFHEPEALGRALYWSFALGLYGGLAIFAGGVCQAKARRAWMAACAFVSLSVAVFGGGAVGLAFVVLPAGMLTWVASRGSRG
jgi:hypothetical protein